MKIMSFIPWMDIEVYNPMVSVAVVDTETGDTHFHTKALYGYRYDYNSKQVVRYGDEDQNFTLIYGIGPQDLITVFSDPHAVINETLYPQERKSQLPILREKTFDMVSAEAFVGGHHLMWVLKEEHIREIYGRELESYQISQGQHPNASNPWEHFCFFCCVAYKKWRENHYRKREEAEKREALKRAKEREEEKAAAAAAAARQEENRKETLKRL